MGEGEGGTDERVRRMSGRGVVRDQRIKCNKAEYDERSCCIEQRMDE